MLDQILSERNRVHAFDVRVTMYKDVEPGAQILARVDMDYAFWHVSPEKFLQLLKQLPDNAGNEAVRLALETNEMFARRGPAPQDPPS